MRKGLVVSDLKFSAILVSWKRQHNLPALLASLRAIPEIDEIILWNNNADLPLVGLGDDIVTINSGKNFRCFARFCIAPLAKNPHLWMQDDDLLVSPEQFRMLAASYAADDSRIHGREGRPIDAGRYVVKQVYGEVDIVIGQSMMFHKKLLHHVFEPWQLLPPTEDDIAMSITSGRKHVAVQVGPVRDLGMADSVALCVSAGHYDRRNAAVSAYSRHLADGRSARERALEAELAALKTAHAALGDSLAELRGSTVVRVGQTIRHIPGLYSAFATVKRVLRRS